MQKQQNPYHFLNTYCTRTPLFSLNFYKKLFNLNKIGLDELKNIWEEKNVKEALFLASPNLCKQLEHYFEIGIDDIVKKERLKQAFLKYIVRFSTRCTPFGLFAGVATGSFNKRTEIELKPVHHYSRLTKFDSDYLVSLLDQISNIETIKSRLLFYPNNTLYKVAHQYRYIEYRLENAIRSYSIEAIEITEYLEKVIFKSKSGKTIQELAESLVESDISHDEANNFVRILIDNQVLISELELNVTGDDALTCLIKRLRYLKTSKEITQSLNALQAALDKLDKSFGNQATEYVNIIDSIKKLETSFEAKYLFQTDLFCKTEKNELNIRHAYTIKKTLPLLNKLSSSKKNENLQQFKKAFLERYENREMPLAQILDVESGIGYIQNNSVSDTTPFLRDVTPRRRKNREEETIAWTEVDTIIFNMLMKSQKRNEYILELTDKDFEHIEFNWDRLSDTLSAFIEVVRINDKEEIVIHGLSANAGNLLARFTDGDTQLLKHTKNIVNIEQRIHPEKILAEIAHLPEARTGNILKRPHLRDYEIPYLAKSDMPESNQILIDDLVIQVKNDSIILKSKRLKKEIFPRLTNAHNYAPKALPIYHFLCDLQMQNKKSRVSFSWPPKTGKLIFLPRVTYKGAILSKARWNLQKEKIQSLMMQYHDDDSLLKLIREWRGNLKIPKYVQLVEGDNTLLIDLEHLDSIRLLLTTIKNNERCRFEEFLYTEDTVVNRNKEQFTNECIVSLYNERRLKSII